MAKTTPIRPGDMVSAKKGTVTATATLPPVVTGALTVVADLGANVIVSFSSPGKGYQQVTVPKADLE